MTRPFALATLIFFAGCGDDSSQKLECAEACGGETPHCDTDRGLCVACVDDAHCEGPLVCFETSGGAACGECRDASECGGGHCVEGACIECTVSTEANDCGDFACDPATLECTETERGALERLDPCRADSECATEYGYACVMTRFMDEDDGLHCLKAASEGCSRPLTTTTPPRVSASWAGEQEYCGFNESSVSAEAVRAMLSQRECASEDDGSTCGPGGLCRSLSGAGYVCTVLCGSDGACPLDGPAAGCGPGEFCGS